MSASEQPLIQFGLKPLFLITALTAGYALAWKLEMPASLFVLFLSYTATCYLFAATGVGHKVNPIVRGAMAGALLPAVYFTVIIAARFSPNSAIGSDLLPICLLIGTYGALFGVYVGSFLWMPKSFHEYRKKHNFD